MPPEGYIVVGKVGDVPKGSLRNFLINSKEIVVANINGQFYALGGVCTHRGVALVEGWTEHCNLVCGGHLSKFDLKTGRVTSGPAKEGESIFNVIIEQESICIKIL